MCTCGTIINLQTGTVGEVAEWLTAGLCVAGTLPTVSPRCRRSRACVCQ